MGDGLPVIPAQIKLNLAFDPVKSENEAVRKIFSDRIARNLWLGIKWRHLTSQYFDDDCLKIADRIKAKSPKTPAELEVIFRCGQDPIFMEQSEDTRRLAEALLPYVTSESDFRYDVSERRV